LKIQDLYQAVTNGIIKDLEAGTIPWTRPWTMRRSSGGIMPTNYATGRNYSGINIPILWHEARVKEYAAHSWLTFKQALELGGHVRKGEKATTVVFTKKLTIKESKDDDTERRISMLRTYALFNASQCEGIERAAEESKVYEPHPFIAATGAVVRHEGNQPMFVPSRDFIAMPRPDQFKSEETYIATLLHECVHWSGAEKRLHRDLAGRFGTRKYAAEELVAELGAAFLCACLNITGELRHADYIANWLELLKHDERAIFTASSKASQAADYLRSFSETEQQEAA
jgi:antirestriction protein ArdC